MDDRVCMFCGEQAREGHHVLGRGLDEGLVVDICTSCHRGLHRDLEDVGVVLRRQPPVGTGERVLLVLRIIGSLLVELGEALLYWAARLAGWLEGGGAA